MAHDVFISYSTKDKPIADGICANLEAAGIRCWIAPRDIVPGVSFPAAISTAISASRIMVLVFSAHSNASEQVSRELGLAADNGLIIIPFKIDDTKPDGGKDYYLSQTHWLDALNPPTQEQIDHLIDVVCSFLSIERPVKKPPVKNKTDVVEPPQDQGSTTSKDSKGGSKKLWAGGLAMLVLMGIGGYFLLQSLGAKRNELLPTATQQVQVNPGLPQAAGTEMASLTPTLDPGTVSPAVTATGTSTLPPATPLSDSAVQAEVQSLVDDLNLLIPDQISYSGWEYTGEFSLSGNKVFVTLNSFDNGVSKSTQNFSLPGDYYCVLGSGGTDDYVDLHAVEYWGIGLPKKGEAQKFCDEFTQINQLLWEAADAPAPAVLSAQNVDANTLQGLADKPIYFIEVDPTNSAIVYAGTEHGLFKSMDGGRSWFESDRGFGQKPVSSLAIDPRTPNTLYATINSTEVLKSIDGGKTWFPKNKGIRSGYILNKVITDPTQPNVVYAGTNGKIFKSIDAGENWTKAYEAAFEWPASLTVDPKNADILYLVSNNGLYKSTNGGTDWNSLDFGITTADSYFKGLVVDPTNSLVLYLASSGGVWKSVDAGSSWQRASQGIEQVHISELEIDPTNPKVLYAGSNYGEKSLYKTIDGAVSWTLINHDVSTKGVYSLGITPSSKGILYVGTFYGVYTITQP